MAITLEQRRRHAAIIACMVLISVRAASAARTPGRSVAAVLPMALVMLAVRANDVFGKSPLSLNKIARLTGMPRQNVARYIEQLIEGGAVERSGDDIKGTDKYLLRHLEDHYIRRIARAIIRAGRELEAMGLSILTMPILSMPILGIDLAKLAT